MEVIDVVVSRGREKKLRNFYPWLQKGEVSVPEGTPDGAVVRIWDHQKKFVGIGTSSIHPRFPVRVWSLTDEPLDQAFFVRRIQAAKDLRDRWITGTNARRLLFAEADRVPGLIVDDFDGHLVVQVRQKGAEVLRDAWLPALIEVVNPKSILEKSDMAGRDEESLPSVVQALHGNPPSEVLIEESGMEWLVPTKEGLKTGSYLDQRQTRRRLESLVRPGDQVLDTFCYTGGFALMAQRSGADSLGIDINPLAIHVAQGNASRNNLSPRWIEANVFEWLADESNSEGPFDWIVLDPPAIAKKKGEKNSLKGAIWKLCTLALPKLKPGGTIIVCTCSYQLSQEDTLETCRDAASDLGLNLALDAVTFQDVDHPAPITFPEALYLKCLWLRRLN